MIRFKTKLAVALLGLLSPLLTIAVPLTHAAAVPRLYLQPSTASVTKGSTVSLELHLDTSGVSIDTVNVVLQYPQSQLNFSGLDKGGSYFDTFLPAVPTTSSGKLNFSAARLAEKTTADDVLVGRLSFTATADNGNAAVSLDDSQVASNGVAIDTTNGGARLSLAKASGPTGSPTIGISAVRVSALTLGGGSIEWKTAVAATSSVDYGADSNYGLSAGSSELSTTHRVTLGGKFAAKTVVHYRVTSVDSDGNRQSSADQTFTTQGYTVRIQVVDGVARPQPDVSVSIADSIAVKTDSGGYATIKDVAAGSQKVSIGGKTQSITVKAVAADAASTPQQFKLVATTDSSVGVYVSILVGIVLLAILSTLLYKHPLKDKTSSDTPVH